MGNRRIDPSVKREYLEWLLVPPGQREPRTKTEMCELLGVSHNTLLYWEASDEFQLELTQFKRKMAGAWYADILGGLFELSQQGPPAQRVAASKLLLDHLDVGKPEDETEDLDPEAREKIRLILKEAGYNVVNE